MANPAVSERLEEGVKLEVVETPQVVPPRLPAKPAPPPPASPPGVPFGRAPAMPPRAVYYEPAAVRRQRAAEKFGVVRRLLLLVFNVGCFGAVLLALPLLHRDLFDLGLQYNWPELGEPAAAVLGMGITWLAAGLVVAMATTLLALVAVPGFGLGDALGWFLMIAAAFAITGGAGGYVEATDWDSHCEYVGLVGVPVMAILSLLMTALQLAEVSRAARGAPGCGCGCAILGIMLLCLAATVAVAVVADLMDEAERTRVYEPPVAEDEFYEDYDPYFDGNEEEKK